MKIFWTYRQEHRKYTKHQCFKKSQLHALFAPDLFHLEQAITAVAEVTRNLPDPTFLFYFPAGNVQENYIGSHYLRVAAA